MFFKRKKEEKKVFNRETHIPVIRISICTGEQVAGFKDRATGHFEEVVCLRSDADRKCFLQEYGIREEELEKEW